MGTRTNDEETKDHEREKLLSEIRNLKKRPRALAVGSGLIFLGLYVVLKSILFPDNISAFIGLTLIFIGGLLFYISPTQFIKKTILDSTITETLKHNHRLLKELDYQGKPTYISPSTILGFTEAKLYIPKTNETPPPTDEQLTDNRILLDNPDAIKLTPPGDGLHKLIEQELKTDFSTSTTAYLQNNLEKALVEGLEIAESLELEIDDTTAVATTRNNIFQNITEELNETDQIIGDPLTSAIACIIARSTRKPITIESIDTEAKDKIVKATFRIHDTPGEQ